MGGTVSQFGAAKIGVYLVRADLRTAREAARQLAALAEREQDLVFRIQAHKVQGQTRFQRGEIAAAHAHLEHGIALYDPLAAPLPGPGVWRGPRHCRAGCLPCGRCGSWAIRSRAGTPSTPCRPWRGYSAQPYSWAQVLYFGFMGGNPFHRDVPTAAARAERLLTLCHEQAFALWLAGGLCLQGWSAPRRGNGRPASLRCARGWRTGGAPGPSLSPYFLALLAEAYLHAGQTDAGLGAVAEALARTRTHRGTLVGGRNSIGSRGRDCNDRACRMSRRPKPVSTRRSQWPASSRPDLWNCELP